MTCHDCIHFDACKGWVSDKALQDYVDDNGCDDFKNKADWQEALEKQIPKKPFAMAEHCKGCPTCKNAVSRDYEKGFPFCMMCGQALDWSGWK